MVIWLLFLAIILWVNLPSIVQKCLTNKLINKDYHPSNGPLKMIEWFRLYPLKKLLLAFIWGFCAYQSVRGFRIVWIEKHQEVLWIELFFLCFTLLTAYKIWKYIKEKQWWDTIDFFDRIIGEIGLGDSRVDALMLAWSVDEDFWVRRIAIDHQLLRKERTNTELLEQILVNNLGSDEFFINKAIGWSLRDYSKTDPEWVRTFISKYRDRMDKLSIREGSKYI